MTDQGGVVHVAVVLDDLSEGHVEALRGELVASEAQHRVDLERVKDSAEKQELEVALELSRMAISTKCPDDFCCPISLEIMEDPVILAQSAQTYEKKQLQYALIERPGVDPKTNARFEGEPQLIPNIQLRGVIEQWRRQFVGGGAAAAAAPAAPPPPPIEYSRGGGGGGGHVSSPPRPPLLRKASGVNRFSVSWSGRGV